MITENVNLQFTADVHQAKTQVEQLQLALKNLVQFTQQKDSSLGYSQELQKSIGLAVQLKANLASAVNVKTGQLDLSKFSESLNKSKTSIKDYRNALIQMGPEGQKVFASLASSIMQAEVPLKRTNKIVEEFAQTMKNAAKWQISSTILHGFMGSMQQAYGYAKDLNNSLNDIRIVTGYNTDQMAKFASEANKTAKALSSTTTDYTDAALIYYQQGLSDQEIKERTDVTIKMANATGESAKIVSDQMTAVWNNFDDGSKSLEYYADVMTKLGAATASSTDEIATGLSKFAAISNTVGLSYEYATAALTTITAKTRESADTVGTALKAIFARIQGLELGDTLEDGTDLNKYSQALEKVGVNIKDSNGELKNMDTILKEMAGVWETLSRDEKVALAEKVAGVRQYNQLMSLMENWDFMEENLGYVESASGSLDEQAEIYAESWEASRKRVKAAAEAIYNDLLKDDFFIAFNNSIEDVLNGLKKLIDSIGGVSGVLSLLGTVATKVFSSQIAEGVNNFIYSLRMSTEEGRKEIIDLKKQAAQGLINEYADSDNETVGPRMADAYRSLGNVQQELLGRAEDLTAEEQKQAQILVDCHTLLVQNVQESTKALEAEEKKAAVLEANIKREASRSVTGTDQEKNKLLSNMEEAEKKIKRIQDLYYQLSTINLESDDQGSNEEHLKRLKSIIAEVEAQFGEITQASTASGKALSQAFGYDGAEALWSLKKALNDGTISAEQLSSAMINIDKSGIKGIDQLTKALMACNIEEERAKEIAQNLVKQYETMGDKTANLSEDIERLNNSEKNFSKILDGLRGKTSSFGDVVSATANVISSFSLALSSIKGVIDTLNNKDLTFGEKMFQIFSSLSIAIPSLISSFGNFARVLRGFDSAEAKNNATKMINTITTWANKKAQDQLNNSKDKGAKVTKKETDEINKNTGAKMASTAADKAKENSGKFKLLTESLKQLLIAFKGILIPVAGLLAFFTALIAAAAALSNAYQEDARAIEEAQEKAKIMTEEYNKAKDAYENLKASISNYTSAKDGLKELTEGTAEFTDQITKANEEALKLIHNYSQLSGKYSIDDNGLINIDEDALSQLQKEEGFKTQKAQVNSLKAEQEVKNTQLRSNQTDYLRESKGTSQKVDEGITIAGGVVGSAALAGIIGTAIGSALGPIGAVVGGAVGAALGGVVGGEGVGVAKDSTYRKEGQDALDKLAQLYSTKGDAIFTSEETLTQELRQLGIVNTDVVEALTSNLEGTREQITSIVANTQAIQALNESLGKQLFGDEINKDKDLTETQKSETAKAMGSKIDQRTQELLEDIYKNKTDKDIQQEYADLQGYDAATPKNGIGKGTYYYTDEQGERQQETLDDNYVREILARNAAIDELEKQTAAYIQNIKNIAKLGNDLSEGVGDALTSFAGGEGNGSFENLNKSQLDKISKLNITEDQAEKLGYNSLDEFQKQVETVKKSTLSAWDDIDAAFEGLSLKAARGLQKASEASGKNSEDLLKYYNKLSDEDKEVFVDIEFDRYKTEESWENEIEFLKSKAEVENLEVNIKLIQDASKLVSEDMTVDNYNTLRQSEIWDKEGIIEYEEFLKMSLGNQKQYLADIEAVERDHYISAIQANKEAAEKEIQIQQDKINKLKEIQEMSPNEKRVNDISDTEISENLTSAEAALAEKRKAAADAEAQIAVQQRQQAASYGLDVEEVEEYAEQLQRVAGSSKYVSKELKNNSTAARELAMNVMRTTRGVETLAKNFKNWKDILKNSDKASQEAGEAYNDMADALSDLTGVSKKYISNDFIDEHLDDIEKAATGSESAIDSLKADLTNDIVLNIIAENSGFINDVEAVKSKWADLQANMPDVEAGVTLKGDEEFVAKLNDLILAAGMTKPQVNEMLSGMGFTANYAEETQTAYKKEPDLYKTHREVTNVKPITMEDGSVAVAYDVYEKRELVEEGKKVPVEEPSVSLETTPPGVTTVPKINTLTKTNSSALNNYSGVNKGGGSPSGSSGGSGNKSGKSSTPAEKVKKTKKDDVIDRYKTSDSLLKRISNSLSKVDAKMESAYGARRVKLLQNSNKLLQTQLTLLGKQRKEAEEYYKLDKYNVKKAGKELGLNFKFDGSVITNYAGQMEKVYNKLNAMEDHMNSLSTKEAQDEYKEKYYDPYKEKVDDLKEYIDTLEDTKDKLQEIDEAALEAANQFRSQHLEALTYTIEIRFDVQDRYLKYAEYMLKKVESRSYSAALAVRWLNVQVENLGRQSETTRKSIESILKDELFDNNGKSIGFSNEEVEKFFNGELTPRMAAALEQNEEAWNKILEYQENLLDQSQQILDLRTEINDKVSEAFDEWTDDMDTLIDEFSHYTSVMDSYIDIVDLLGKNRLGMSNEDMAEMHKSQAENYRNEAESLQLYNEKLEESLVELRKGQSEAETRVAKYKKELADAEKTGNDLNIKTAQEQLRASLEDLDMWSENVQKAEQKIRDNDEAARQAVYNSLEEEKEAFLSKMEESVDQIEKSMAGSYGTIAEMQKDFDQHSEIDERYVDDYERMYKLTKMSRELSKKMDESNNLRVKKQLAKFQQEIVEYQEEGRKLSQYDLEYLQKKYDLRVAELALEEAQQAKTQVRLTRDTEGNYSYTYTADEDSMADAQQAYEDKLYEITDFSNNYIKEQTSQLLSAQQSYIDSLREIHQNAADGMYKTTEEYQQALDECTEYYTMKMQYHSGEIDKASINNTLIYATDYAVYEEYTGKKLTAAEKYRNEMDRAILEEKAKVEKLQIEKQDALNEINRLYHEGYYESEEAFQAALAQTEQAYNERIDKAKIKTDGLIAERIAKYGEDSNSYDLNAKKKDASEEGFINNIFNQYLPKLKESNETASSYVNEFIGKIGSAKDGTGYLGSAKKSYDDLSTGIDTSLKIIGTSQETFKKDTKAAFDEISKSSNKTKGDIEKLAEKVKTLKKTITAVRDFQKDYCNEMAKIIAKNEKTVKSIDQVYNKLAKRTEKVQGGGKVDNGGKTDGSKTGNNDDSKGGKSSGGSGKKLKDTAANRRGVAAAIWRLGGPESGWDDGSKRYTRVEAKFGEAGYTEIQKYLNAAAYKGDTYIVDHFTREQAKKYVYSAFKTGGYTGAWGDQGKMAILHEKELVLNKDDTENMLKMVAMVRDITKALDYTGLAQLSAVSLGAITTSNESLNQNVVIQAEFPNAIYASEIEAALNNLVNSASQYANRK